MCTKRCSLAWFVAGMALAVSGNASAQGGAAQGGASLSIETKTETDGVAPGNALRAAVLVTVPSGWHINAHKPLDTYLIPTELTFEPREGFTSTEWVYPEAPTVRLSFSPEPLAVYEGAVAIGVVLRVAGNVQPGAHALKGTLRYQACNDAQCWAPAKLAFELPVKVVAQGQPIEHQNQDVFDKIAFAQAGHEQEPHPGSPSLPAPFTGGPGGGNGLPADWQTLAKSFTVAGRTTGYLSPGDFEAWLGSVEAGQSTNSLDLFAGMSLWLVILTTLLGGLALNLTPCVLPLIPINLAIIGAGAQAGSRARGFLLGGFYGAGIAISYGILGLVVVLTSSAFGTLNASPWFNLGISVVFVLLALAMFDVFLIDLTRFQTKLGLKEKRRGAFVVALGMGAIAALLAGACVAPVVIAVVLLARNTYVEGTPVGLALPFLLGAGMALPWPFAGAGLAFLPKPGKWMVWVRNAFGVVVLGFAGYYGHLAYTLFADQGLVDRAIVDQASPDEASADEASGAEGWTASLAEGLAEARRENKPVLIDFWAPWCKSCLAMNATTFKNPQVKARLERYIKVRYEADFPDQSPARDVMGQFGVAGLGLPIYIVLLP